MVEPGRAVIATSTLTLYRVEARKRLPDGRELVAVDGGLSDNPRPSLYGQRYEVLSVSRPDAQRRAWNVLLRLSGRRALVSSEREMRATT